MTTETFTCAYCDQTFPKGRSDEEAMAEAAENGFLDTGPTAVVCDDCYNEFMGWLTPDKKTTLDAEWKAAE